MRLTLIIPSLERGGAERVMSILASCWAGQGREVTLLTLKHGIKAAYEVDSRVRLRNLGLPAEPAGNVLLAAFRQARRVSVLRRAIRESNPDLVISFMERTNVLTLIATRDLGVPVIISERVDPRLYEIGRLWQSLRQLTYPWASVLVCQSNVSLAWFEQKIRVRGCVIPNPVPLPGQRASSGSLIEKKPPYTIVAMGRLVEQKGFDLLLDAFGQLAAEHRDWSLIIMGDGPLRDQLVSRANALKIESRVHFAGTVADPFPILRRASLFVLSSRFDGFPNALCEAMACGVAAISFDCPSGPADIIRHGVDGILVPPGDVGALAAAIDHLIKDPHERARLASRAPEVSTRFSVEKVLLSWNQLFERIELAANTTPTGDARGKRAD